MGHSCINYWITLIGKPTFFFDTFQWFADSLINTIQLIILPMAMVSVYNNSGSMNIRENETNRVIETLKSRMDERPSVEHCTIEDGHFDDNQASTPLN